MNQNDIKINVVRSSMAPFDEYTAEIRELWDSHWLTNNGIKAIWSFSTVRLQVPKNVTVQYENLALSLAHLHQKVKANN